MQTKLDYALDAARRGFRVFPVRVYGKKPAISQFQIEATTNPDIIRRWWTNPATGQIYEYNIGILTNDMVVTDTDTRKGDFALQNFYALGGHFDTFAVSTPSGGYHNYYDGPDSALRVNILPGVDIRSHNGYVLGPGSYTDPDLANDPQVKHRGSYAIINDTDRTWVPLSIERQLRSPTERIHRETHVELDTPTAIDNATEWLKLAPPAVWGEGGDVQTFKVAAKLVRDFALTEETSYHLMLENWNDRCQPHGWPHEMLWEKIQNAHAYGTAELGQARPEATFGNVKIIDAPLMPEPPTPREAGVYMGNAIHPGQIQPRQWLAQNFILRGQVTALTGGGAVGKSLIQLTAAAHFALGRDFGPYKLKAPGRALRSLIYNAEDDIEEASRRLVAICQSYNFVYADVVKNIALMDISQGELILAYTDQSGLKTNAEAVEFIRATLIDEGGHIAWFDPLVNLHGLDENNPVHMRFLVSVLKGISVHTRTAVVFAHHTNKGAGRGERGSAEGVRGSGAIINSARVAIMLSNPEENDLREYGIDKKEGRNYVRVDDAKTNLFAHSGEPVMWLKWDSVRIQSTDVMGVMRLVNMKIASDKQRVTIGEELHRIIFEKGSGSINMADARRAIAAFSPLYAKIDEQAGALARHIERIFREPVKVGADTLTLSREAGSVLIKIS